MMSKSTHSVQGPSLDWVVFQQPVRGTDLPRAIALAKTMGSLVQEGLALNPNLYPLRLLEISLRRFAHDGLVVTKLATALYESDSCPPAFRTLAFMALVENLAEGKHFESALSLLQRSDSEDDPRLTSIRLATLARRKMIGKETNDGRRIVIPEVVEHFLKLDSSECYADPVLAAELQDWLGDPEKALSTLTDHLEQAPADWDGIKLAAMIHWRLGHSSKALEFAQLLVQSFPWKAESYDWLAFIAEKTGRPDLLELATTKGDQVFAEETRLYGELRTTLDQ